MPTFHAIVLGIVQGLTEFLPVSSSGHLIFIPRLFGWPDQGITFDLVVHLGSLLAVAIYLRSTIKDIFPGIFSHDPGEPAGRRLGWYAIASAIPAGIVGALAGTWIESQFRAPVAVACNLIFWGFLLWLADVANRARHAMGRTRPIGLLSLRDALIMGAAQVLALFPGVSRSGITITAGLAANLDRRAVVRFSFLMSIPIIGAAAGNHLIDILRHGLNGTPASALIAGFLASMVGSFLALWGLEKIIERWSFRPFAIYRLAVGVLILFILM